MSLVNTLIIGTQKGGTTSLFHYLEQHPDVCSSKIKETNYFLEERLFAKGESYFHAYFEKCSGKKIVLTSHAHLLPGVGVPERVKEYNKEMKIIVILRNPVERAFSAYRHALKHGWEQENVDFLERINKPWKNNGEFRGMYDLAYFRNGLYHQHLQNWLNFFSRENLLILTTNELKVNVEQTMGKVYRFLNLDSYNVDTSKRLNEGGTARSKLIQLFITKFVKNQKNLMKRVLRILLPKKLTVFLRSTLMPWLMKTNTVKAEANLPADINEAKKYFEEDLKNLKKDFGITL